MRYNKLVTGLATSALVYTVTAIALDQYKPTSIAQEIANKVRSGDCVTTIGTGSYGDVSFNSTCPDYDVQVDCPTNRYPTTITFDHGPSSTSCKFEKTNGPNRQFEITNYSKIHLELWWDNDTYSIIAATNYDQIENPNNDICTAMTGLFNNTYFEVYNDLCEPVTNETLIDEYCAISDEQLNEILNACPPEIQIPDEVFEDEVFEDEVFEDEVFEDEVFEDEVFEDEVFEDEVFEDEVFEDEESEE